ncbi:MAG: zinc finger domain-containing protein [archaeon]
MKKLICSSCDKETINEKGSVMFKCPSCGQSDIIRCLHCRKIGARYKCPVCEFEGPN